ncbi:ribonuclease III domain-containing protein [Pelagicoccus mobilis]|uniref:Uncharacterized protein n=1 Tax=Pelagicoccus mobilis TaxID=415221 RepID=A0A934S2D9_9BACT|nr:ribonuclease III domain-containing protein [Pelagicoccus mobilis]MBK1878169.1 hypothetical protein [Pelagicoccus mobilis]
MDELEKKTKAWVGDAVLALYAREWILRQTDIPVADRATVFKAMTSNLFLSAMGQPTQVEADIGIVYEKEGLQAAFDYMEERLLPVFKKQRRKPKPPGNWKRK